MDLSDSTDHVRRRCIQRSLPSARSCRSGCGCDAVDHARVRPSVDRDHARRGPDASGGVLPGVTVMARNVDTGRGRETVSSARWARIDCRPCRWAVTRSAPSCRDSRPEFAPASPWRHAGSGDQLQSRSRRDRRVDRRHGEAPLISTTSASLGRAGRREAAAELPLNGRNYIDLSLMQAGVSQNKGASGGMTGVWFTANGAPMRSNNFTIDGAPMNSLIGGAAVSAAGTTLGLDGIREYRVVTNSFGAEVRAGRWAARSCSSARAARTSGTARRSSTCRNSALDARNYFDAGDKPLFRRNNFGAAVGGPIRRDKTFFWAVYEGLRQRLGMTARNTFPPAACHTANIIVDGNCVPGLAPGQTLTVAPGRPAAPGAVTRLRICPTISTRSIRAATRGSTTASSASITPSRTLPRSSSGTRSMTATSTTPIAGSSPRAREARCPGTRFAGRRAISF